MSNLNKPENVYLVGMHIGNSVKLVYFDQPERMCIEEARKCKKFMEDRNPRFSYNIYKLVEVIE